MCIAQISFWEPADSLNSSRVIQLSTGIGATYSIATIGLASLWYADTEQGAFHFFDDWNQWNNMDKYGHFLTAYHYTRVGHTAYNWTGMEDRKAMWLAVGIGNVLQTTIEVLDGFSEKWGFSVYDMAFNISGSLAYATQHLSWKEQRIIFKLSAIPSSYPDITLTSESGESTSTLRNRTDDLFGNSFSETFLKDYNQQTLWISINPKSFLPESKIPSWINIAGGISTDHIYGGFSNRWEIDGQLYSTENLYDRTTEFYLSLDIDLTRIKTNSHFLKGLFTVLNVIKIPAPAIS